MWEHWWRRMDAEKICDRRRLWQKDTVVVSLQIARFCPGALVTDSDELFPGIFKKVSQKAGTEIPGVICEWCRTRIRDRGRGMGKKFCGEECRNAFNKEAFRQGRKVIRRCRLPKIVIWSSDTMEQRQAKFLVVIRELSPWLKEGQPCGT